MTNSASPETVSSKRIWAKFRRLAIVRIVLGVVIIAVVVAVLQLGFHAAAAASPNLKRFFELLNPRTCVPGAVAIVVEAGNFLAAAYMMTRRLWLVIGAHFGWNFTESGMGAAVSGNVSHGLVKASVTGPTYLTGGIFGI